jgi:hypothetical protein
VNVTDRPTSGDADTPSTEAARSARTHPAADAAALRKLGSEAGDTERMTSSGHDRQGTSAPGSVGAAAHDSYWRRTFASRDYADPDRDYEYYRPAYRYGWEARDRHGGRSFDEVEQELREAWDRERTGLEWSEALPAIRDAFERPPATGWSDPGNPLA